MDLFERASGHAAHEYAVRKRRFEARHTHGRLSGFDYDAALRERNIFGGMPGLCEGFEQPRAVPTRIIGYDGDAPHA